MHNDRTNKRIPFRADLSAHIVLGSNREPLRCLGVNVSRDGLGVVTFFRIEPSSEVIFVSKERGISLEVVWCRADEGRKEVFHVGLKCHSPAHNLIKVCENEGLLKTKPKKREMPVSFESLRGEIVNLRVADPAVLQRLGLDKLAHKYRAYPINFHGSSLLILLTHDLKPQEAAKLSEEEAGQRALILRADHGQCVKIWPAVSG